ncbi:hypothetical protein [Saccharomonospora saliphila]|uniref:hypothetical protein n=1 Tax=Saccharomonospora saliphila TaxID=369829 RepID=UPI000367EE44|nr:hypothetical protein [Saccharomonospora saliphila]
MNGFQTSQEDLDALGTSVGYLADDVRSVRDSWRSNAGGAASVFATSECGSAFETLHTEITDLLGERADALDEVDQAIRDGGTLYQRIESTVTETLDRVLPFDTPFGGRA